MTPLSALAEPAREAQAFLQPPSKRSPALKRAASGQRVVDSLTQREREILNWVATGKRDSEIATILGISVYTTHKHVQNIFRKLQVGNRTAAAMVLLGRQ